MKNLLNLRWLHGSPNQTGETLTRENRLGIVTCLNPMRTLFITLLLITLGVGQMWADDHTGHHIQTPYIYYYNSEGWANCGFLYGRSWTNWNYTCLESLSLVDNTEKLYYDHLDANWGNDYNEFAIVNATGWNCESNDISARWGSVSHTGRKVDFDFDTNNTYYIEYTSSAPTPSYISNAQAGIPTKTTTLNIKVKESGASSYSDGSTSDKPATTIKITGTYLSAQGTTTRSDASWSSGSSCSYNTVISGKVTPTYETLGGDWQFDGWYEGSTQKSTSTSYNFYQTSATTVEARFTRVKYTINFDFQTGSGGTSSIKATYGSAMPSITLPSLSNYSFQGYFSGTAGSGTKYYNADGSSARTSNLNNKSGSTLYAKWTQSVVLNANTANHGSGANGSATATLKESALSSISHPSGETGYSRTGYFTAPTGGTKVLNADGTYAGTNISGYITSGKWSRTSTTTLYAQWDNHYTVTFNQHNPSFAGTESTTATYGSAMPSITVPSKTGYKFDGYYTGANGSGTKYYNANGTSANPWAIAANTTLHANWIGIDYEVAFDANEGSGNMENEAFTYGAASKALTTNTFTRTGYYFLGWNTNADGSGAPYYNGKSVSNLTTIDGGIVTLYAQWAKQYTLYFIVAGCSWGSFYAKSEISYNGQTYYPLGGGTNGKAMTRVTKGVYITNFTYNSSHIFSLYKIDNVPEGSQIKFSNNGSDPKGNMSWSADKPYYMYGNNTWYAIDHYAVDPANPDTISKATNMCVYLVEHAKDYGIDQYNDGQYAIIKLNANTNYQFKYRNWLSNTWSGCTATGDGAYIIKGNDGDGVSAQWALNGGNNVYLQTSVTGEYKFLLNGWTSTAPNAKIYFPVGVSLTLGTTQAVAGVETTTRLTAAPAKNYLITNPTYYYQISTDNGSTWTTIAETSSTTYDYTFAARKCKFRVILKNDAGLKSESDAKDFTAITTRSFYVYNPYNNASDKWTTLHLYTWDSNTGTRYNGDWPGKASGSCINDNDIVSKGGDWYYITINENANCFMLVGDDPYTSHQTITCYVSNYRADAKCMIYTESNQNKVVAYKAKGASDYRLKYTDASGSRYSPIYNTTLDGATVTTSMWMDASSGTSLTIQRGTGNDTWADIKTYTNSSNGFAGLVDSEHRDHGYVFQMQLTVNTGAPASSSVSNVALYNGSYYVRTDGLNGGWNDYKKSDHAMHHSAKSLDGTPAYDYYLCKWIGSSGTDVKFTVANDYNPELVESLEGDVTSTDPLHNRQTIPQATNVRFSWNTETNTLTRAYLSAATEPSSRFLVMVEMSDTKGKIYKEDGQVPYGDKKISGLNNYELIFADNGNWVYQLSMMANPQAKAKVTAKYNDQEQEFIPSTTLIGGSGSSKYNYRIIYDFKTNILTNAWVASGSDITEEINLNTNVMVIRNGQNAAAQIHFEGGQVINAKKLVSVMQFEYNNMVGKMNSWNSTAYQYCMYYISFPFNVKVSDIFGIGEMGVDWRLQYYDGEERALKGFFEGDGTTTFWKDVPANGTLKAYEGYSLLLNRVKFNDKSTDIWENKGAGSSVYLYFPSTADAENIKEDEQTIHVPEHTCTINRTFTDSHGNEVNHMNTDSHWNMMGTPLFENKTASTIGTPSASGSGATSLKYFYAWNASTNTLQAQAALDNTVSFSSMYSYMVQYAGNVTFRGSRVVPNAIAAREKVETKNYNIKLQVLDAEDNEINRTFVTLEEGASADFVLNEDMYMVTNKLPVNIYTFAGNYDVAGNVLPIESTTVPVGVIVKTAGTYTFSMPSHFDGTVTLVDTYAQTRTNLGIEDYTVNLEEGTFNSRFLLELNIHQAPTAIDGVSDGTLKDGKAHKFLQNGVMYILQNGVMYDAQGKRVK